MRSDLSVKFIAQCQVALYDELNACAAEELPFLMMKTASVVASTADVCLDTLKHPLILLENTGLFVVNLLGAPCSEKCSLADAENSLNLISTTFFNTLFASAFAVPKWVIQTHRTLSNPATTRPYNQEAQREANLA